MKRCPQCLFIYPDTDSVCDFDQTPLVSATEAEIAAVTTPRNYPHSKTRHRVQIEKTGVAFYSQVPLDSYLAWSSSEFMLPCTDR
jgi:hypothetical protein